MSIMRARMGFAMRAPALTGTPAATWSPSDLGAALKGWWKASDHGTARMTDDGAGLISSWTDAVSGVAVTAALAERPTWSATSLNSAYPGLTFNGAGSATNGMTNTSYAALPTGSTAGEIWLVGTQAFPGSNGQTGVAVGYGGTSADRRRLIRVATSTVSRGRIDDGSTSLTDTAIVADGSIILGGNWSGTTEGGRINGNIMNPATATIVSLATLGTRLRIGAGNATTVASTWAGVISEVIVTTTLTVLQRQQLEGYWAWAFGLTSILPAGHPYKSARP